jgi:hypothetical protein
MQTLGFGMFEPVSVAVLEALELFLLERGAAVDHEVCPLAGVNGSALLVKRGYQPVEFTNSGVERAGDQRTF